MSSSNNGAEGDAHNDGLMQAEDDVASQHTAREVDQSDDSDDSSFNDDDGSSVSPSILDDISSFSDYDENCHGHDYVLLKTKYDDANILLEVLKDGIQRNCERARQERERHTRERRRLRAIIEKLEIEIEELRGERRRPHEPWSHMLRNYLSSPNDGGRYSYEEIYRLSCKQENMSQKLTVFHPDFCLQNEEVEARRRRGPESPENTKFLENRRFLTIILPRIFIRLQPVSHRLLEWHPFPFEHLPLEIQINIFRRVFVKCTLIHCLSRLDPSNPPEDFPEEDEDGCSQLPTGFHFGTSPCQIALARKPNDVLKALLVCKRWYFIGVHAFYGANTFAFSSLGEWHRFCNGIGRARVERLVNVELMWHGALMPRHRSKISRRSLGLAWFTKTRRLRTLVVHIQECPKDRMRRKYEKQRKRRLNPNAYEDQSDVERSDVDLFSDDEADDRRGRRRAPRDSDNESDDDEYPFRASNVKFDPFKTMVQRTGKQPQFRRYRSMRTVQGIDYIYQLRGMKWVRFKERDGTQHRQSIRDWSFLKDINTVVTSPKQPRLALKSELENLTPLKGLRNWIPSPADIRVIKEFYDESPILDDLVYGSETSESDNADSSSNDTDDDSDSDDGGDKALARRVRNPPNRPNNGGSNCPGRIVEIIDSDSDRGAESDRDTEPNSDNDDGIWPYGTQAISNPSISSSQNRNHSEQRNNDGARADLDDDDGSSGLFVRSGSGSAGDPRGRMEIDQDDTDEEPDARVLGVSSPRNNPLAPPSPGLGGAGSSDPMIIDLTGDDDTESSLFVSSPQITPSIKTELDDEVINLTMPDGENGDADANPSDDFDDTRYINEETPPGSDDESDSDIYPSLRSNPGPRSSSSKRPSHVDSESDEDDEPPAKRPKKGKHSH
ncbi:hypothetical protein F4776DRAFT_42410 [Hypoxylon sp. NC0597]|nr:hypothetical protein F4776DRAFT_42410 [Hypoxylon sp. NC0597]